MKKEIKKSAYIKHRFKNVISISQIVTMHYFEFDKNFCSKGEAHDFWEMVYVDRGQVFITAGKKIFTLKQGEAYFHKPNEFHVISANKKAPSNVFIVSFATSSKGMIFLRDKKVFLSAKLKLYIKTLLDEGMSTFNLGFNNPDLKELTLKSDPPFGSQQIIRQTLEQLLIMIIRKDEKLQENPYIFPAKESMDNHLVAHVIELLEGNIYGKISVGEICKRLNYSKTYISKIFNESCHCSIIEYYTGIKIYEAKRLIRENSYSFSEISDMLYFDNPHYFSRVFKRVTGMTPREYSYSVKIDI